MPDPATNGPARLIDEAISLRTAAVVATPGRRDPAAAAQLRSAIARDTAVADAAARAWTGLGRDLPPTRVRVVSRMGWVQANLIGLRGALQPLAERLQRTATGRWVGSQILGVQLGALLGLLSTKVLGQYILPLGGPGQAQLVVVGPNVLELSERYGAVADDVRRTVLLHELAHRLQFDGVPWLGDHLRSLLDRYLSATRLDPSAVLDIIGRLPDVVRALRDDATLTPLLQLVLTDEQRAVVHEAQALMSLLEGHGNATMYEAADDLVMDSDRVRQALEQRRRDFGTRLLTAVTGLEMKRRQYLDGESFVRTVVDRVGTAGLNRAFDGPDALPSPAEIADPDAWLTRVHGGASPRD
ncbi:MAG: zinc-dependent metalloprotease [Actinobacteria bacterium]|nr:zinc-dependent metalloprotease [Actinomycetota bacterium]